MRLPLLAASLILGACAAVDERGRCARDPACRWCTNPRGCTGAGAACTGLLLGHPGTCDNDPVERARAMTQREEARGRGLSAEGPPVVGHLEAFPGVDFGVARGRCYAAIVRFGSGAAAGAKARDPTWAEQSFLVERDAA